MNESHDKPITGEEAKRFKPILLADLIKAVERATIRPAKIVGFERIERPYIDADFIS